MQIGVWHVFYIFFHNEHSHAHNLFPLEAGGTEFNTLPDGSRDSALADVDVSVISTPVTLVAFL